MTSRFNPADGRPRRTGVALSAWLVLVLSLGSACGLGGLVGRITPVTPDPAGTVWLCRPGFNPDPCRGDLTATAWLADGSKRTETFASPSLLPVDCFYVYPTVSTESTTNADLQVQASESGVATSQAARFSQDCNVWAPIYKQVTLKGLASGVASNPVADALAYQSLFSGWRDYLTHYNAGRPIVFIGDSQGAAELIKLLRGEIDPDPTLRSRMVSAIILGGNVTIPLLGNAGGTFENIPPCRSDGQTGCVIAYSSFPGLPPSGSIFGRPGTGVSLQSGQTTTAGVQVLCINPADLRGGEAPLDQFRPTPMTLLPWRRIAATKWLELPLFYSGQCMNQGGAGWLQVTQISPSTDPRPRLTEVGGADWGFHNADVTLALGDLVTDVGRQIAAYQAPIPAQTPAP